MPDFRVIEGGGKGSGRGGSGDDGDDDFEAQIAPQEFERLAVELLRALARGEDWGRRVNDALIEFATRVRQTEYPMARLITRPSNGCTNKRSTTTRLTMAQKANAGQF